MYGFLWGPKLPKFYVKNANTSADDSTKYFCSLIIAEAEFSSNVFSYISPPPPKSANEWNTFISDCFSINWVHIKTWPAHSHILLSCCLHSFSIWHPAPHMQIELTAWTVKVNSLPLVKNSFTQHYFRWLVKKTPKHLLYCPWQHVKVLKRSIRVYPNLTSTCCNLIISWSLPYIKQNLAKLRVATCFQCLIPAVVCSDGVSHLLCPQPPRKSNLNNHKLVQLQCFRAAFCPINTFLKHPLSTYFLPLQGGVPAFTQCHLGKGPSTPVALC